MAITVEHAADLKRVYQTIFDAFAISTSEIADTLKGINTRYARELCGALQQGNLITLTEDGEGSEAWQTNDPGTYDSHEWAEAEKIIDNWLGVKPPSPLNATSSKGASPRSSLKSGATGPHPCACGCGEVLHTRSVYRPGHDARHAGAVGRQVAREVMETGGGAADLETDADRFAVLPSDALRAKALRIANKELGTLMRQGKNRTLTRNTKPAYVEGIVKVGKNERPARRYKDGKVTYFVGDDMKQASATAAKTFQEG